MLKKYKLKSNKSFQKRFKLTKSGKVKFFSSGKKHGMSKKSRKHNRELKRNKYLSKSSIKIVRSMISCL